MKVYTNIPPYSGKLNIYCPSKSVILPVFVPSNIMLTPETSPPSFVGTFPEINLCPDDILQNSKHAVPKNIILFMVLIKVENLWSDRWKNQILTPTLNDFLIFF